MIFAAKGVLSMAAALFISMNLELDRPFWAVVASIFLQARSESGLVTEKALYLVAGSFIGGIYAVLIIGQFSQMPLIAIALLTLWIGGVSFLSAKVQHVNYNYFLGLTGITAPLIGLLAMSDASAVSSLHIFEIARARISEAMVGAFCAASVSIFFIPFRLRDLLHIHAIQTFHRLLRLVFDELIIETSKTIRYKNSGMLLASVSQLNHDARASSYDGPDGKNRARASYEICNLSIVASSITQTLGYQIGNDEEPISDKMHELVLDFHLILGKLEETTTYSKRHEYLIELQKVMRNHKLQGQLNTPADIVAFRMLCRIVRIFLAINSITGAIKQHRKIQLKPRRLPTFQDNLVAGITALRSMVVFISCTALWIGTGSSPAVLMMMIIPPFFSMAFAPAPVPEMIVRKIIIGAILAIPASIFIALPLMSASSGNFELLIMIMGVPLFIALMAVASASTMPYGLGFCLSFIFLTQPGNEMAFAADVSVTIGLALMTGLAILYASFTMIKTPDNIFIKNRIMRSFSQDLKALSRRPIQEEDFVYNTGGKVIKLFLLKSGPAHLAGLQALRNLHITFTLHKLQRETPPILWEEIHLWLRNYQQLIAGNYKGSKVAFSKQGNSIRCKLKRMGSEKGNVSTESTETNLLLAFALEISDEYYNFSK